YDRCRVGLLLGMFSTGPTHLRDCLVVLTGPDVDRVPGVLRRRWARTATPWLCAVRALDAARFSAIMELIWADRDLHRIGYAVLDELSPGWRQRLSRKLARAATGR